MKTIFSRLIKTTGENVEWNGIFTIAASNLILPGKARSLFFQLEQKRMLSHITEFPTDFGLVEEAEGNDVFANVLNMLLYIYGKWGVIPGLKVDKDYKQLNILFGDILKIIDVEVVFSEDNIKFYYKDDVVSYEEVIRKSLDWANIESGGESELEEDTALGLWYNMCWSKENNIFEKKDTDGVESRIGFNFYRVDYICPECGKFLQMVVFPVDKEFLIDTVEGKVYLARAYTCTKCFCFYTPTPGKLISEGSVYCFDFEEDEKAYEDYLSLLGAAGDRCTNYKFNEFESQRNKKSNQKSLKEECEGIEDLSKEQLSYIADKVEAGYYPKSEVNQYYKKITNQLTMINKIDEKKGPTQSVEKTEQKTEQKRDKRIPETTTKKEVHGIIKEGNNEKEKENNKPKEKIKEKSYEQGNKNNDRNNSIKKEIKEIKEIEDNKEIKNQKDVKDIFDKQKTITNSNITNNITINNIAKSCEGKTYLQIKEIITQIKKTEAEPGEKERILFIVSNYKTKQAQIEANAVVDNLPKQHTKKEYENCLEKLINYDEDDIITSKIKLEEKRNYAEKKEIDDYIKKSPKKTREEILSLYENLKKQDYGEHNVNPYIKKIYEKVYEMDQEAIHKICPNMLQLSFEHALESYHKIQEGMFLPELKENTLKILDKRLTKIKVEENKQLIKKLKKEMERIMSADDKKRIRFYDARNLLSEEAPAEEITYCEKAIGFIAGNLRKYEYPILICDSSYFSNGKEGFILTPDHFFCKSIFHTHSYHICDIKEISQSTQLLKPIQMKLTTGNQKRLANIVRADRRKLFANTISDFISYLKEKPDSRQLSYLVKDTHTIKCCIRCGHKYKGDGTCPKCGYKENK